MKDNKSAEAGEQFQQLVPLGESLVKEGKLEEGIAVYTQAIKLQPDNAYLYSRLANFYLQKGDLGAAIANYSKAVELNPRIPSTYDKPRQFFRTYTQLRKAIARQNRESQQNPKQSHQYKLSLQRFKNIPRRLKYILRSKTGQFRIQAKLLYNQLIRARKLNHPAMTNPNSTDLISIGVLDYKNIGYSSENIGDYIQTLACLKHIAPFYDKKWYAWSDEIKNLLGDFQSKIGWKTNVALNPKVSLVRVNRDYSSLAKIEYPRKIWLIMNGWFMHPCVKNHYDFPPPDNIRPIFISFHLNEFTILEQKRVVEYLNKYQPIGCRDWSTVYLLRSVGIEAFFSGCLTLTLDIFSHQQNGQLTYLVDYESYLVDNESTREQLLDSSLVKISHNKRKVAENNIVENIDTALELLGKYSRAKNVITSRLHCYLPCLAMGVPVELYPPSLNDIRFSGLYPLEAEDVKKLQSSLNKKMEIILTAILETNDEAFVYELWNKINQTEI